MIHVAPCSCELHVRIRELEAELASQKMVFESVRVHDEEMRTSYLQARARAEKAEARVAELEKERHELRLAVFDTETLRVKERKAD